MEGKKCFLLMLQIDVYVFDTIIKLEKKKRKEGRDRMHHLEPNNNNNN
jgi:hypothetical protein